ncbi:MAG TPA: hypothetical protein VGC41_15305 [Kofleriaceae bacterium]
MPIAKAIANAQQSRAIVLYNEDGRIVHTHVMYALNGAMPITREDAEKRAFDVAKELGRDVANAKALYVEDPSTLTSGRFVVKNDQLVATPITRPEKNRSPQAAANPAKPSETRLPS